MKRGKHVHHYFSHRGRHKHVTSVSHRLLSGLVLPIGLVLLAGAGVLGFRAIPTSFATELGMLLTALGASLIRLFIAYLFALVIGVLLGLLAERGKKTESILLPVFDVLESMPVLAFFPVIIILFLHANLLEGAAIFIIFFSMVWNIAFSVVGGVRQTPADILSIGRVFGLSTGETFRKILLPSVFPAVLTGSILAVADGWNIVIVAEALHAYAPVSTSAHDLFGIGSILVTASAGGDTATVIFSMTVLVVVIAFVNIALWQPLLSYAERYKFE